MAEETTLGEKSAAVPVKLTQADIPHLKELRWAQAHEAELRERYGGQWIAIDGERIVGSGPQLSDAAAQAGQAGVENPLFMSIAPVRIALWNL